MFAVGFSTPVNIWFMVASLAIAVPTGVKIFNWIGTMWMGRIRYEPPMLFAIGFILLFMIGGLSGIFVAVFPIDLQVTDSYFVVAHFHYVMGSIPVFAVLGGLHYWYPKMTGRMLNRSLGIWSFWVLFVGFNMTFFPMHAMGLSGMPRRISSYPQHPGWERMNEIATLGSFVLSIGVLADRLQLPHVAAQRPRGRRRPLAGEHARVVHQLAAAAPTTSTRCRRSAANGRWPTCAPRRRRQRGDAMSMATAPHPLRSPLRSVVADYVTLTKPRIMMLILITAYGAMAFAADGLPSARLTVLTLFGLGLSSGGASALNHVIDRDLDARMRRTAGRPVASGRVSVDAATGFGIGLIVASTAVLAAYVNVLTAALALSGALFYVIVYTVWLKRRTPQNIVIGGAAGAVPPLVGWAAVTGHVGLAALFMFALVFYWTPPHFWALAILAKDDYAAAGVPMLPVVRGDHETARQILLYTVLLVGLSVLPFLSQTFGLVYLISAVVLGGWFLRLAVRLLRDTSRANARGLFLYSLAYLALMFAAIGIDRINFEEIRTMLDKKTANANIRLGLMLAIAVGLLFIGTIVIGLVVVNV